MTKIIENLHFISRFLSTFWDIGNMVQSIDPQTHHGKQLQEMFCFSYDRPNCLGNSLAAEHLIDYTLQFMNTYNRHHSDSSGKPWAAFVSFIDSHEDSSTLISYLDSLLLKFLQDAIAMKNTMILFLSDHGEFDAAIVRIVLVNLAHHIDQYSNIFSLKRDRSSLRAKS